MPKPDQVVLIWTENMAITFNVSWIFLKSLTESFGSILKIYGGKTNEIRFFKELENWENDRTMFAYVLHSFSNFLNKTYIRKRQIQTFSTHFRKLTFTGIIWSYTIHHYHHSDIHGKFSSPCQCFQNQTPLALQKKRKFFIKDFSSKCKQISMKRRIWSHLLKKSLMENFILCVVILLIYLFGHVTFLMDLGIWARPHMQLYHISFSSSCT